MLDRFKGDDGRLRLLQLLRAQHAVSNDQALAEEIANLCELKEFEAGSALIEQGGNDNGVIFILTGVCEVLVNQRLVAERGAGQQVGEMAAIDPSSTRSATVKARTPTVAAMLTDIQVNTLGQKFPDLYRRFAVDLAKRLRERAHHIKAPNGVPRLFVGSSVEGLEVVQNLQRALQYDNIEVLLWTDNVVPPGHHVCDALLDQVRRSDFAVFHASADDKTWSRKDLFEAPRDNVILELGMFLGALGRERCFLLTPRGSSVKIPSDLLGITALSYDAPSDATLLQSKLGPAVQSIRDAARRLGTA